MFNKINNDRSSMIKCIVEYMNGLNEYIQQYKKEPNSHAKPFFGDYILTDICDITIFSRSDI